MELIEILYQPEDIFISGEVERFNMIDFVSDIKLITSFCKQSRTRLRKVDVTNERGFPENVYYFSNNLGGYNTTALKKSIKKRN